MTSKRSSNRQTPSPLPLPENQEARLDLGEFRRHPVGQFYDYMANYGCEWNYVIGAPLNGVAAYSSTFSSPAALGIGLGWNYLDGVYSIWLGITQICDEDDYRRNRNIAKGVLNILSGVQMFLLSYNPALTTALGLAGGAALAPTAFAISTAFELAEAAIDFYSAYRDADYECWVKEREMELEHMQKRKTELETELANTHINKRGDRCYLETKIAKLNEDFESLKEIVGFRAKVRNSEYTPTADEKQREKKIQAEYDLAYGKALANLAFRTASFIGMTMIAVAGFVSCPPLLAVGLAITFAVALFYLYRNGDDLDDRLTKGMQTFGIFAETTSQTPPRPAHDLMDALPSANLHQ